MSSSFNRKTKQIWKIMNRLNFNMLLRVSLLHGESGNAEKFMNIETQEKFGNDTFRVAGFRNIYRRFRHGRGRTNPKKTV